MSEVKLKPCEWQMVPKEPSKEMCAAGFEAYRRSPSDMHAYGAFNDVYSAMLAASPTPPVGEDHRERADAALASVMIDKAMVHTDGQVTFSIQALREEVAAAIAEAESPLRAQVERLVEALEATLASLLSAFEWEVGKSEEEINSDPVVTNARAAIASVKGEVADG